MGSRDRRSGKKKLSQQREAEALARAKNRPADAIGTLPALHWLVCFLRQSKCEALQAGKDLLLTNDCFYCVSP